MRPEEDHRFRERSETDEDVRSIVQRYAAGESFRDISATTGLSRPAVRGILVGQGVPIRRRSGNGTGGQAVPDGSRTKHRVGDRHDRLVIRGFGHVHKSHRKVLVALCECDCGKTKTMRLEHLTGNRTNNCGCRPRGSWRGVGDLSLTYFANLRRSASRRGILFNVEIAGLWGLFERQQARCALSGFPITLSTITSQPGTASLDRKDSSRGYTVDNVQWVHKDVNAMKMDMSETTFTDWCRRVATHRECSLDEATLLSMQEHRKCRAGRHEMTVPPTRRGKNGVKVGDLTNAQLVRAKCGARSRGLSFDLSLSEAWTVYEQQGGVCALSGLPLSFKSEETPSLDRVDSRRGYAAGNVQWVHPTLNRMKMDLRDDYFRGLCSLVARRIITGTHP